MLFTWYGVGQEGAFGTVINPDGWEYQGPIVKHEVDDAAATERDGKLTVIYGLEGCDAVVCPD